MKPITTKSYGPSKTYCKNKIKKTFHVIVFLLWLEQLFDILYIYHFSCLSKKLEI